MRLSLPALLLCAALTPLHAAGPASLDLLLPPTTKAVVGVRAARILELISQQPEVKDLQQQAGAMLAATPWAGFDPFRDIDDLVVATTATGQNPPSLVVISGRFNPSALGSNGRMYQNAYVVQQANSKQATAILDGATMLVGDWPMVKAALDRNAAAKPAASPMAARIADFRSRYDLWVLADGIDTSALPKSQEISPFADQMKGIDRIWFGAAISDSLELAGEVHAQSPEDAARIGGLMRGWEMLARAQMQGSDATKFELQTEGQNIRLSVSVPEAEWKKALQTRNQPSSQAPVKSSGLTIVSTEQKIHTDSTGSTVTLVLPGKR
jgi:hypothetical protein